MTMSADELENAWYGLQFGVRRSIRYHQRRRGFFDGLDKLGDMLAVLFGSAAIYGVLAAHSATLVVVASVVVTVVATLNLVLGSSRKAWLHADLARRFIELERQLLVEPDEGVYRQLTAQRLSIEAEEPPILRVLDSLCHNEQLRAEGLEDQRAGPISVWQRLFAQVFDLNAGRIGALSGHPQH